MESYKDTIFKGVFENNIKFFISKYPFEKRSFYYTVTIEEMKLKEGSVKEKMLSRFFDEEIDNWLKQIECKNLVTN